MGNGVTVPVAGGGCKDIRRRVAQESGEMGNGVTVPVVGRGCKKVRGEWHRGGKWSMRGQNPKSERQVGFEHGSGRREDRLPTTEPSTTHEESVPGPPTLPSPLPSQVAEVEIVKDVHLSVIIGVLYPRELVRSSIVETAVAVAFSFAWALLDREKRVPLLHDRVQDRC